MSFYLRFICLIWVALNVLLALPSQAQIPGVTWANGGGGGARATYDRFAYNNGIVADGAGNTYVTGNFTDTLTLGTTRLVSTGGYDIYVAKLDAAGRYQWVAQAIGSRTDMSNGIALDKAGNVYITGYTEGYELNFGPYKLTNPGFGAAMYVAQLSPTGSWQRVTLASSPDNTFSYTVSQALAVDDAGAVYVTGGLNGTVQFGSTRVRNGGYGTFVAKLGPTGIWEWANLAGGIYDFGKAIALDQAGNPYITGYFESRQVTFGAFTLTNRGSDDIFVAKLTASGNWQWVTQGGGRYTDYGFGIAVDPAGNAYVTGTTGEKAPRFGTITPPKTDDSCDLFIAKLDAAGTWQWVSLGGSAAFDYGAGILLQANTITVVGTLGGPTARFGMLPPVAISGEADAGIIRLDTDGQWQWALASGGMGSDYALGIAAGPQEEARVVGYFDAPSTTFGATTLVGGALMDERTNRFAPSQFVLAVAELARRSPAGLTLWPNPSQGTVYATGLEAGQPVQVFDSRGRLVVADARPAYEPYGLTLPPLAAGMYIVRCGSQNQKLIIY